MPIFRLQLTCLCVPSFHDLRVEFLLKTDGGYPRDAGVFFHDGKLFVFSLVPPQGFLQKGSRAFPAAPSARAFDATAHLEKAPGHSVQVK